MCRLRCLCVRVCMCVSVSDICHNNHNNFSIMQIRNVFYYNDENDRFLNVLYGDHSAKKDSDSYTERQK